MRVAIHVDGPVIRGNERQVIALAAGLRDRGHYVAVSCRKGGPVMAELQALGIDATGIRPGGDTDPVNALRFAAWLRRGRFDAVLLTSWKRAFISGWAARVARVPRVVFRIGGIQPIGEKRGRLERYALRRWYHAIVPNSVRVAEHMTAALPDLADRVYLVPNGIDINAVSPVPLRDGLGVPGDAILAVAIGGMERNKGFDLLIDAAAMLDDGVHVVLVGGGTPEARALMEERARRTGVSARVHFLGHRSDARAVAAACDVFVLPSRSEGFPVVMLEAIAAGVSVVATDVGGVRDALGERMGRPAAGWIVPVNDAAGIAAGLREAVEAIRSGSPAVAARVREASWRAENWFSLNAMVSGYEAVLAPQVPEDE
jgi:glycosyltransferase involved in cell wall biosynthesis